MARNEDGAVLDEKSFQLGFDAALGVTKAMLTEAIEQGRTLQECLDVINTVNEVIEATNKEA